MPTVEEIQAQQAVIKMQQDHQAAQEQFRATTAKELEVLRSKMELMRMAHTTLIENKRALPVEQRQITTQEILDMATALEAGVPL